MAKTPYTILFLGLTGIALLASGATYWWNLPPASVHQWRQSDAAALMWHYFQGNKFAMPEVYNLETNGDGYAVGEWPATYWLAGQWAKIFGFDVAMVRWVHGLICLAGFWALGWLVFRLTANALLGSLVAAVWATTPVLTYYSANYLPDAPALGLVLVSWALLYHSWEKDKSGWIYFAALVAAMAASLKLTAAISWACMGFSLLLLPKDFLFLSRKMRLHFGLASLIWFSLIALCRWWITGYNALHQSHYFLASWRPFWQYDLAATVDIFKGFLYQSKSIVVPGSALLVIGSIVWIFRQKRQISKWALNLILLHFTSVLLVFFLFFRMFKEHDYYSIVLFVAPVLCSLVAMKTVRDPRRLWPIGILFLFLNTGWTNHILRRWQAPEFSLPFSSKCLEGAANRTWLSQLGVPDSARVYCPEDPSPNAMLFLLNRKGWTAWNFGNKPKKKVLELQFEGQTVCLALTDTTYYAGVYQELFPVALVHSSALHIYSR